MTITLSSAASRTAVARSEVPRTAASRISIPMGLLLLGLGSLGLGSAGCASKAGDDVECPTCNNTTEILVGARCVPVAEVEECGPDGHPHGTECHCFSGQAPTTIGGKTYCLQQGCGEAIADTDALACDEIGRTAHAVTASTALGGAETAHVGLGKVTEVSLPAGQESYVHFEADEAGEFLVYLPSTGILDAALSEGGVMLEAAIEGANEDCPSALPEVWGIEAPGAEPIVLRFKAGNATSVRVVIYESAHAHE